MHRSSCSKYKLREKFPRVSFAGGLNLSDAGFDLLSRLLTYDPKKRITAEEALNHRWFTELPLPQAIDKMPVHDSINARDRIDERSRFEERNETLGAGLFER